MREPVTRAARLLHADLTVQQIARHPHDQHVKQCWFCDALANIEEEVRQSTIKALEGTLLPHLPCQGDAGGEWVHCSCHDDDCLWWRALHPSREQAGIDIHDL